MRNERGLALPVIILAGVVLIGIISFGVYKYQFNQPQPMVNPNPAVVVSPAVSPTASASAVPSKVPVVTPKPIVKPTIKPSPIPTLTPTPTVTPTPATTNSSAASDCSGKSASITIQANNGSLEGDTLVRVSVRQNTEGCSSSAAKEEILRQGASSTTLSDLTPATYNLYVSYHGNQYNETFVVKKGENASKTVTVNN